MSRIRFDNFGIVNIEKGLAGDVNSKQVADKFSEKNGSLEKLIIWLVYL